MATAHYAVIGHPVRHSLSPALFGFLFQHLGIDADYRAHEVAPDRLASVVEQLRQGDWQGFSVTLPHKEAVPALLTRAGDHVDPLALRVGAINTLARGHEGGLSGYNTDVVGFCEALRRHRVRLEKSHVLVLGAGGAARSAVYGALDGGAARVTLSNRTFVRAQTLAEETKDVRCLAIPLDADSLDGVLSRADVLVNSSRAGMQNPAESPLPVGVALRPGLTVLDMVYRPLETALLRLAREQGATPVDGLWMLVFQAVEQLRRWTGIRVADDRTEALHRYLKGEAS